MYPFSSLHHFKILKIVTRPKAIWDSLRDSPWAILVLSTIVIIVLFVLYGYFFAHEDNANWGDSFGALTSLFSGLAFAGVVAALWIQRKDLKQTQEEMQLSTKAQEEMAKQMKLQIKHLETARDLELLHKFIEVTGARDSPDLTAIARTIIRDKTKVLLRNPENANFCAPNINLSRSSFTSVEGGTRYIINIHVPDLMLQINKITFRPEPSERTEPQNMHRSVSKSNRDSFSFVHNVDPIHVEVYYSGVEVAHEFKQTFEIGESIQNVVQKIGGPELVNMVS